MTARNCKSGNLLKAWNCSWEIELPTYWVCTDVHSLCIYTMTFEYMYISSIYYYIYKN